MASVLHIVSYFPPDRMGGVGEVVATLHRGLLAAGHLSRVVTTGTSREDPTVLPVARTPGGFALLSTRALSLARTADVVHVHHGEAIGLLGAMVLARVDTPVLLTLHVSVGQMARGMRPYRAAGQTLGAWSSRDAAYQTFVMPVRELMDRAAIAMSDGLTFISRSAASDTLGAEAARRATVVYNALPPAAAASGVTIEPCDLLFVGTPSTRKRVESLPFILAAVRRRRPAATLRIVGFDAAQAPALVAHATSLGLRDAIRFEGRKRSEDLAPYYRAAGVLLVPSSYEGLPMVILEAFREGLPCVATAVSGHPEVIADGVNGRLVPLDDVDAMAEAALEILAAPSDVRAAMGDAARRTVDQRFGAERQLREYLALYASLRR